LIRRVSKTLLGAEPIVLAIPPDGVLRRPPSSSRQGEV
jgi:hypothetical protein